MDCPRCGSLRHVKRGRIQGIQRYRCKDCGRNYTVLRKSTERSLDTKRLALQMYFEGLGFRSIGRILKVSHVSVYKWIRNFGSQIHEIRNDKPVKEMELDELHTYVGYKKNWRWIWTCVSRDDREYVDFELGNRGTKTGLKLWERVGRLAVGSVMADYWKPYEEIVPDEQLIQTKAETYTVESYNALTKTLLGAI